MSIESALDLEGLRAVGRVGWTIVSADRSRTAHHEHTVVVRNGEPLVLTAA